MTDACIRRTRASHCIERQAVDSPTYQPYRITRDSRECHGSYRQKRVDVISSQSRIIIDARRQEESATDSRINCEHGVGTNTNTNVLKRTHQSPGFRIGYTASRLVQKTIGEFQATNKTI